MGRCIRPGDFFRRGETPRELRSANWGAIMTASMQTDETSSERTFLIDELIRGRRAKRGFTNRPVPIETVKAILSVARYAPSSSNIQPWQCYVLTGKGRERVVAAAVLAFDDGPENFFAGLPFLPPPPPGAIFIHIHEVSWTARR